MTQFRNNDLMGNAKLRSLRGWFKRTPFQNVPRNNYLNHDNGNEKLFVENTCITWRMSLLTNKEKSVQRTAFGHWIIYVIHKLERRKTICLADNLYRRRLKRRTLDALLTNSVLRRCKTNHKLASVNDIRKQKILLKVYFASWRKYVRQEQMTKINIAQCFSETKGLKKCFHTWKAFVSKKKNTKVFKDKMLKASTCYTTGLLRKSLSCWLHIYSELRKKTNIARKIYKDKMLKRYYSAWTKFHEIRQNKSRALEEAWEYFEKKLLRHCLKRLILHVTLNRSKRCLQQRATEFYRKKKLKEFFVTWRDWYIGKQEVRIKLETFQQNFDMKIQRKSFAHWQSFVLAKKCKKRKLFLAMNFDKMRLQRAGLKTLKNYLSYRRQKKILILPLVAKQQVIAVEQQKIIILNWRRKLYGVMQEKREIHRAVEFYEIRHVQKYFFHWKKFSEEHKLKSAKKRELQELASVFMTKKYLVVWATECKRVLMLREKESRMVCILKQKTLDRYFNYWKKYMKHRKEKKIGIETAKKVHKTFLLRAGLRQILRMSLYQIELTQQNRFNYATAMSLERFETLGKYFYDWLMLTRKELDLKNFSTRKPLSIISNTSKFANLTLPQYMIDQDNCHEFITDSAIINKNFITNKF